MAQPLYFPDWRDKVIFSAGGPQPQVLHEDDKVKVVVVGLEPGSQIPAHPGAGSTVVIPAGAIRGVAVHTRLAFIAVRITG
ncbi:MAG: hypothetical protein MUC51_20130 [Anaerolineae bacterium]|nr:hypothetical protein [Anaerolineae bacterium]